MILGLELLMPRLFSSDHRLGELLLAGFACVSLLRIRFGDCRRPSSVEVPVSRTNCFIARRDESIRLIARFEGTMEESSLLV